MTHDNTKMTFSYSGWGRNFTLAIENDDADFLPKVLDNVAAFLRAVGFEYVGVRKEGKSYIFHHDYKWDDPSLEEEAESDIDDLLNELDQEEVNAAADQYWDSVFDKVNDRFTIGDEVYYTGKGRPDEKTEHGGYKNVSLINMRGKLIDIKESPLGNRALVKWDNWFDGHNGMGGDPEAQIKDTNYWWTDINNLSN